MPNNVVKIFKSQSTVTMTKLWIILFLTTVFVAVYCQQTTTTTTRKINAPFGKAQTGAPPPKGKSSQDNNKKTTSKPKSNKITRPPAKSSSSVDSQCNCQNDIGMDKFKMINFVNKTWYMLNTRTIMAFNPYTGDCSRVSLSAPVAKNVVTAETASKFSVSTIKSKDTMTYMGQGVFMWKLKEMQVVTGYSFNNGSQIDEVKNVTLNSNLKFVVIETDYTSYAVVYICGNYTVGLTSNAIATTNSTTNQPTSYMFLLLSSSKTTDITTKAFTDIIKKKYLCINIDDAPSKQDDETCKLVK